MKLLPLLLGAANLILILGPARGDTAPSGLALDTWKSTLPFYFKYDGKESPTFLSSWQTAEETATSDGGQLHRYTYTDPATKLKVTAQVRTFTDYDAIDWVLKFTNTGDKDTPIIEDIQPLHWAMPVMKGRQLPKVFFASGSNSTPGDFKPQEYQFYPGQNLRLGSGGGRSSNGDLPFFNMFDEDHGFFGAIGWTGNWQANFARDKPGENLAITAGMQQTHFLLHAGETVRTPRIVLLNWKGDRTDAQNLWRRLVLAYYSPKDQQGKTVTVPLCFGSWGTELIDTKLKAIQDLHAHQVPFDVYWVDAGWYGTLGPKTGTSTDAGSQWDQQRGTWIPSAACYPNGFKPLSDALHAIGVKFLLWLEPEQADSGSKLRADHPDWFFGSGNRTLLLNLGKPEARQGITDQISKLITDAGMDWYRQDFNVEPEGSWHAADTPDRVGTSEINDITGLYQYWDDLRAKHPGLQIDNCASGGRRLDIETISRSVALWRSDLGCNFFDPMYGQTETQSLNSWVPLNSGVYGGVAPGTPNEGASLIYAVRSNYSAGYIFGTDRLDIKYMKAVGEEFDEVRPFFSGDFYPLQAYSQKPDDWAIWQWHRPDLKSGVAFILRRPASPYGSIQLGLHAVDPNTQYAVEIRSGLDKSPAKEMSGKDLANLQVTIPDKPGSALVFYQQK
jgi:alpha-galactosidase